MNRITNEQREAIVRKAIAERDSLLVGAVAHPTGFDAWWEVFFALAGKDKAWPVKQAAREAFAALAPTSAALQESKAVTADGDFARMAEAEGATVDWGDHGSPPSFPSWGAWGRFCDAVRAIAPPSPVKEVTDQQIYDAWFALSEADNRVNEHVRLGGVLPFARAVLALAGGKRGGE